MSYLILKCEHFKKDLNAIPIIYDEENSFKEANKKFASLKELENLQSFYIEVDDAKKFKWDEDLLMLSISTDDFLFFNSILDQLRTFRRLFLPCLTLEPIFGEMQKIEFLNNFSIDFSLEEVLNTPLITVVMVDLLEE